MHNFFQKPDVTPIGCAAAATQIEAELWSELQADLHVVRASLTGLNGLVGAAEIGTVSADELAALLRLIADRAKLADDHATALFSL